MSLSQFVRHDVSGELRESGFLSVKPLVFVREAADTYDVIEFQQDRGSPRFTLNFGKVSKAVRRLEGDDDPLVSISQCHWNTRPGGDQWWPLPVDSASDEVLLVCRSSVQHLDLLDEGKLLSEWKRGESPGATRLDRIGRGAILALALQDYAACRGFVADLLKLREEEPAVRRTVDSTLGILKRAGFSW